jgi:hypothetical protein
MIILAFKLFTEWFFVEHELQKNYGKVQVELYLVEGKKRPQMSDQLPLG